MRVVSPAAWPLSQRRLPARRRRRRQIKVYYDCDLIGPQVSTATLKAWVDKAAQGLTDFDEQLRALLGDQPVAHFDETGLRIPQSAFPGCTVPPRRR